MKIDANKTLDCSVDGLSYNIYWFYSPSKYYDINRAQMLMYRNYRRINKYHDRLNLGGSPLESDDE